MALPTSGLTLRLECLGRSNFTLDVNDKVEAWIDQATYGNFVQPTEAKRPEYFDDIDGSGPILRFGDSGASHWLQNLNTVNNLMNTAESAGNGTEVFIRMTFTSMACPVGPMLVEEVRQKAASVPGVTKVVVEVTFTPPWEPSDDLKAMMGLL